MKRKACKCLQVSNQVSKEILEYVGMSVYDKSIADIVMVTCTTSVIETKLVTSRKFQNVSSISQNLPQCQHNKQTFFI